MAKFLKENVFTIPHVRRVKILFQNLHHGMIPSVEMKRENDSLRFRP